MADLDISAVMIVDKDNTEWWTGQGSISTVRGGEERPLYSSKVGGATSEERLLTRELVLICLFLSLCRFMDLLG